MQKIETKLYPVILGFAFAYFFTSFLYKISENPLPLQTIVPKANRAKNSKVSYERIIKRNIFNLVIETPKETVENTTESVPSFNCELVGIIKGRSESYAFLRCQDDLCLVKEGDTINGARLVKVYDNYANFRFRGKIFGLYLEGKSSKKKEVKKAGFLHKKLKKSEVFKRIKDINSVIKTVMITPYYRGNTFIGYRITKLTGDSPLRAVGLRPGDIILSINGEKARNPKVFWEIMSRIEDLDSINIEVLRYGKKENILIDLL